MFLVEIIICMVNIMETFKKYAKLKSDIIALKKYVTEQYGTEFNPCIDVALAEVNDLLLGIERGQLYMPYKKLRMNSTWNATDGAYNDDTEFRKMIFKIQDDIYSIKKHIVVLAKYKLFSNKKINEINWLFPNLECKTGKVKCISYMDEDMLTISFPSGYKIDLGFIENEFVITITKHSDWANIIDELHIKLRSAIEEKLQSLVYKYENL